jgi:hypothetical protein
LLVQGGSLEAVKKLRENKREQIEKDRVQVREAQEKFDKEAAARKKASGSDPMGQPGPVTA